MFKYIWVSLLALSIISCNTKNPIDPDTNGSKGQLSFSIDMTQAPDDVVALQGILSRADHDTVFFDFEMRDNEAIAEVEGLISGTWLLRVNALDEDGHIIYSGSTDVTVVSGQTTTVYLNLEPTTGSLKIIVSWGEKLNPVAYYPFNGNAKDESGNGNDGVVFGASLTEDRFGNPNHAYKFDGFDDYIGLGNTDELEFDKDDFTISIWFKTSRTGKQQQLFRKGKNRPSSTTGRWVISIDSTNVIRIVIEDNEDNRYLYVFGNTIVTDDKWHQIVLVANRDEDLRVYIDKEIEIYTTSLIYHAGPIITGGEDSYIGYAPNHDSYFLGSIDDIVVWRKVVEPENVYDF
jgi:Concanavalin A-like lectin/glucanases superfamily